MFLHNNIHFSIDPGNDFEKHFLVSSIFQNLIIQLLTLTFLTHFLYKFLKRKSKN